MPLGYYKTLTLDHTQAGAANSTDWPLCIGVGVGPQAADADLKVVGSGGYVQSANGYDIRPFSDITLTTTLDYELVFYDGTTGSLEMHVRIPTLSHTSDTVIYLGFGDASLTTDGSTTSTWDSSNKGVWHFKDGTSLTLTDSTSNGHTASGTSLDPSLADAEIAGGVIVSAFLSSTLGVGTSSDFSLTSNWTYSAWVTRQATSADNVMFSHWLNSSAQRNIQIGFRPSDNKIQIDIPWIAAILTGSAAVTSGSPQHIAVTRSGSTWTIYINGGVDATVSDATAQESTTTATMDLGFSSGGGGGGQLDGVLDEVRIASAARSPSWILSDYNSQKPSSTFIAWGAKVSTGGGASPLSPGLRIDQAPNRASTY